MIIMNIEDQIISILKRNPTGTFALRRRIKAQPDDIGDVLARLANDGKIEAVSKKWWGCVWRLKDDG